MFFFLLLAAIARQKTDIDIGLGFDDIKTAALPNNNSKKIRENCMKWRKGCFSVYPVWICAILHSAKIYWKNLTPFTYTSFYQCDFNRSFLFGGFVGF